MHDRLKSKLLNFYIWYSMLHRIYIFNVPESGTYLIVWPDSALDFGPITQFGWLNWTLNFGWHNLGIVPHQVCTLIKPFLGDVGIASFISDC